MHIHALVWAPGFDVFPTQLYFKDDPARSRDARGTLFHVNLEPLVQRFILKYTILNFYMRSKLWQLAIECL